VLVCYPRDAILVHLPMAGRRAVGRQQLRFRLSCRMAVDDVVLGPRTTGANTSRTTMPAATNMTNLFIAPSVRCGPEGRLMTRRIWARGGCPDMKRFRPRQSAEEKIWRVILEVRIALSA
jgi:hypothetical protein